MPSVKSFGNHIFSCHYNPLSFGLTLIIYLLQLELEPDHSLLVHLLVLTRHCLNRVLHDFSSCATATATSDEHIFHPFILNP